MDTLVRRLAHMKNKVTKSDFVTLMHKSTSNDSTSLPQSQIRELVAYSHSPIKNRQLLDHLWKKLAEPREKWRKILKALFVIQEIAESGSYDSKKELKLRLSLVSQLSNFEFAEYGVDRGANIRQLARELIAKISSLTEGQTPAERERAKEEARRSMAELRARPAEPEAAKAKAARTMVDLGAKRESVSLEKDFLDYERDSDEEPPAPEWLLQEDEDSENREFSKREEPYQEPATRKLITHIDEDFLDF